MPFKYRMGPIRYVGALGLALALMAVGAREASAAVYALNYEPGAIWQFGQNSNGALRSLSPASIAAQQFAGGGEGQEGVAISRDGRSLYVTEVPSSGSGLVAQFDVSASGALKPKSTPTVVAGTRPRVVALSPNGKNVYVNDIGFPGNIWEYSVQAGGALKPTGSASGADTCGLSGSGMAVTPNSRYVYVGRQNESFCGAIVLLTANATGQLSETHAYHTALDSVSDVVISPDGKSLYAIEDTTRVDQFDIGTGGSLTAKTPASVGPASPPTNFGQQQAAISPNGRSLYVTAHDSSCGAGGGASVVLRYAIGSGGHLAAPQTFAATPNSAQVGGVAVSGDGKSVYVAKATCGTGGGGVLQYNVSASGGLTEKSPFSVNAGTFMMAIAASPLAPQCVVPNLKGKTLAAAKQALKQAHCALGTVTEKKSSGKAGIVLSQRPTPGKHLPAGSKVSVVLSKH